MIKLKRRAFLAGTSAVLILPALPTFAADYKEAGILKEKVSTGALPSVKDRLPENPLVLKPLESVGKYGGDWNMALVGGGLSRRLVVICRVPDVATFQLSEAGCVAAMLTPVSVTARTNSGCEQ